MYNFGEEPQPLVLDVMPGEKDQESSENTEESPMEQEQPKKTIPPKHDEVIWAWKVRTILIFYVLICNIPVFF